VNGRALAVFLFRANKSSMSVLNEQISVDEQEIERCARHIFSTLPLVHVISFYAIATNHEETERIIKFVRSRGLACLMTIDGRICAGAINYCVAGK
jgi:hypothetical protein